MKKFRKFISAAALALCAFSAQAQVRNYVGIVKEQFYPEMVKFLEDYKKELLDSGYTTYSKSIDSYLEGGFGSGFVYVAQDGTNYVITNRHVVNQAQTASIEFENPETGAISKYEGLTVFATDDDIDIAILKFPEGKKPFKTGLSFASEKVQDGTDVWSAGFPGLANNPVWQLGKGSVTNSSARIKELLDPSISTIIQHSAEIDGGNSGGPLMISSPKANAGYLVVGVNTWKAAYRQNTNFAIPAKVVTDFIANAGKTGTEEETVKKRAQGFVSALNDKNGDFTSITKYISYEAASSFGKKNFESALKYSPSSVRSTIIAAFSHSPLEGLRYAVAYQMWTKFSVAATEGTAFAITSTEKKAESYAYSIKNDAGDKTAVVTLKNEHGLWRVENLLADGETAESVKNKKEKTREEKNEESSGSSGLFESPSDFDIFAGVLSSMDDNDNGVSLGFINWLDGGPVGFTMFFEKQPYNAKKYDPYYEDRLLLLGMGLAARVPLNVSKWFCVLPVASAGFDLSFTMDPSIYGYYAEIGAEVMMTHNMSVHPAVGISWKYSKQNEFGHSDFDDGKEVHEKFKNLKLYAKIAF